MLLVVVVDDAKSFLEEERAVEIEMTFSLFEGVIAGFVVLLTAVLVTATALSAAVASAPTAS
jgi:hypothetical protein